MLVQLHVVQSVRAKLKWEYFTQLSDLHLSAKYELYAADSLLYHKGWEQGATVVALT